MAEERRGRIPFGRFEGLPVWQAAMELAVAVFELSATDAFRGHPGLRDQLERAALSVSNNIAEGYERGTHEELLAFLYYAKGSAGEVRSMLCVMERMSAFEGRRAEVERLRSLVLSASRQLGAWLESLKNSDAKGPRHTNDATRKAKDEVRRRDDFLGELRRIVEEHRPPHPDGDPPPS